MIIEPSIFYSIKYCENPGYAKSIINLNTLFVFILAFFFLKAKVDKKKIFGILLIISGSYYIS
jgi:drug/metabolite transporter (DMT)-like permease